MSSPLDELLRSLGLDPVLFRPSGDPSFTVVVRTQGDRPDSLRGALESIAGQTRPPSETLVMVHSAGDTTDEGRADRVARELTDSGADLPPNWRTIAVEGGGRSRPLNQALDSATGDYVVFLDDDDLAMPDWIEAFSRGAADSPGAVVRAVCITQAWTTDGGNQPVSPIGDTERPYADRFDLLAHLSHNETPICSIALPRPVLDQLGLRFDETLPVFEDWELLVRTAMITGVISIPDETSLYRRLDDGNAFTAVDEATWHRTHAEVISRFRSRPVLLPADSAHRLAAAHFEPDGTTRHERRADAIESSPWWRLTAGPRRVVTAARRRRARIRPSENDRSNDADR